MKSQRQRQRRHHQRHCLGCIFAVDGYSQDKCGSHGCRKEPQPIHCQQICPQRPVQETVCQKRDCSRIFQDPGISIHLSNINELWNIHDKAHHNARQQPDYPFYPQSSSPSIVLRPYQFHHSLRIFSRTVRGQQ